MSQASYRSRLSSKRATSQRRGQPGNRGQFAAAKQEPPEIAPIHVVDLAETVLHRPGPTSCQIGRKVDLSFHNRRFTFRVGEDGGCRHDQSDVALLAELAGEEIGHFKRADVLADAVSDGIADLSDLPAVSKTLTVMLNASWPTASRASYWPARAVFCRLLEQRTARCSPTLEARGGFLSLSDFFASRPRKIVVGMVGHLAADPALGKSLVGWLADSPPSKEQKMMLTDIHNISKFTMSVHTMDHFTQQHSAVMGSASDALGIPDSAVDEPAWMRRNAGL